MIAKISWIVITICMLSGGDVNVSEDTCLYVMPIYVKNVSSSVIDEAAIDSAYIPENFTVIRTTLTFICEEIFTNYKELVVGEVINCTRGSLDEATAASSFTDATTRIRLTSTVITRETVSHKSDANNPTTMTTSPSTITGDQTNSATTGEVSTGGNANVSMATPTVATQTDNYRIEPNITYKNITALCPATSSPTYWQTELAEWIDKIYLKVIGAFGVPGNTLALVTILSMKPLTSSSLFIAALAVSDTYVLTVKIVYIELMKVDYILSTPTCGFLYWTVSGMGMVSNWLVVIMTLERFVAVWFPFRVNTLCTKKNAIISMVIAWIVLMGINAHMIATVAWRSSSFKSRCYFHPDYSDFINVAWFWIDAFFMSIFPAAFLFFCNGAIIIGMRRSQALQKNMNVKEEDMREKIKAQQQVTIMLLAISITFIILTGPIAIFTIYEPYWHYEGNRYEEAKYELANSMVYVLLDMNFAVNFYMYFLTGRKFRQQLSKLFGCYKPPKRSAYGTTLATSRANPSRTTDVSMVSMSKRGDV